MHKIVGLIAGSMILSVFPLTSTVTSAVQPTGPRLGTQCETLGSTAGTGRLSVMCGRKGDRLTWQKIKATQRPPGACQAGDSVTLQAVRWNCSGSTSGKMAWTRDRGNNSTPSIEVAPAALIDTLPPEALANSFFDVDPKWSPQIGQSLLVEQNITAATIRLRPSSVKIVKDPASWALLDAGQYDENWMTEYREGSSFEVPATVTVDIWLNESTNALPKSFDVSSGFTRVYTGTTSETARMGQLLDIPLTPAVTLSPGRYFLAFTFDIPNKQVMTMRLKAQQNGTNTLGGYNHDVPINCSYTPTPDAYPQGQAYKTDASNRRPTGPAPGSVGPGSQFTVAITKVTECTALGVYFDYNMIWNPGDLDLEILGTSNTPRSHELRNQETSKKPKPKPKPKPVATPAGPITGWDTRAALPAADYAGLACDPFDPRLKNVKMPNGVGPEARVAAACLQLQAIERAGAPIAPISITRSPNFPAEYENIARESITMGDRLTGGFASPNRSYELVLSNDPDWLCATGASLTDSRAIGESRRNQTWAQTDQSGCPGTRYDFASWRGMNLDAGADTFFSWQLISPQDWERIKFMSPDRGPMSYFPFWSHEFQHQIQTNLSNGASIDGATGKYTQAPWGWFSEGQAEYIGFMTSELTGARSDIRSMKMAQAREGLANRGIAAYDLNDQNSSPELFYNGGYLAYEYLLAHYGLEKTYRWWSEWNSDSCGMGMEPCWIRTAPQIFGMTKDQLFQKLNAYIAQQVNGS